MKTIKCIVAARNSNGEPDFFFTEITCTQRQYEEGEHYKMAEDKAASEGYDPKLVYDEVDSAGKMLLEVFH